MKQLLAQNAQFQPGDAFFHSVLTDEVVESLAMGNVVFTYAGPPGGNFGGYIGFNRISVNNVSKSGIAKLRHAYKELRSRYPRKLVETADGFFLETNPLHFFIYNRDVDWDKQRIALKLNENWNCRPDSAFENSELRSKKPFSGSKAPVYESFVQTYKAVTYDLMAASRFKKLNVTIPKIAWGIAGEKITEPVECDFSNIQFVILGKQNLSQYFDQRNNSEFFTVKNDLQLFEWKKSQLKSEVIDLPDVN